MSVICDYCKNESELVTGQSIYPHRPDLYAKHFYLCKPCNAYVGCHPKTTAPLGRLANKELRAWKRNAHAVFDALWKSKKTSRSGAYKWLSNALNISADKCHIGMFDIEQCRKVVSVVKGAYFNNKNQYL